MDGDVLHEAIKKELSKYVMTDHGAEKATACMLDVIQKVLEPIFNKEIQEQETLSKSTKLITDQYLDQVQISTLYKARNILRQSIGLPEILRGYKT